MTNTSQHPGAHPGTLPAPFDFSQAPLLVIWESTRSCALACDHCRANADTTVNPDELTTAEGKKLIDSVKAMGTPIMILSGGDPLNRTDLEELIRHGKSVGLRMGTIPAATPNLTRERLASLKEAGVDQLACSIDGATLGGLTPEQFEEGFAKLRKMTQEQSFVVKLTEGQHFRRYALQQEVHAGEGVAARVEHTVARPASLRAGLRLPKRAVNAADGFMFVDHVGDICPSGFLPVRRGNVRFDDLATVYRQDEMFRDLRDHGKLKGRCGVCEYREVCGGSRARSWAITGDIFAEDPSCGYQPKGWKP